MPLFQWSRQPVLLHTAVAAAFTVFVIVKWALFHGQAGSPGHGIPSAEGVLIFAPLSLWMLVGNASRFWRPSTRAQLAAAEVRAWQWLGWSTTGKWLRC
jgi:hypothetical protein